MIVARPWMFFVEVVVSMPRAMMISTVGPTARKAFVVRLLMGVTDCFMGLVVLAVIGGMAVFVVMGEGR